MGLGSMLINMYVSVALVSIAVTSTLLALIFFLFWIGSENHVYGLGFLTFLSPWLVVANKNAFLPPLNIHLGFIGVLGLIIYFIFVILLLIGAIATVLEGDAEGVLVVVPLSMATYYLFGFIPEPQRLLISLYPVLIGVLLALTAVFMVINGETTTEDTKTDTSSASTSTTRTMTEGKAKQGLEKIESRLKNE